MQRRQLWLWFISILLFLGMGATANAQNDIPPGVDVVFVVDQSGSMTIGSIANVNDPRCRTSPPQSDCPRTAPTDPDALAIKSLRDGLTPIFERMVIRSQGRSKLDLVVEEHRYGLVLFGGLTPPEESVIQAVPLTRIEVQQDIDGNITSNIEHLLPTAPRRLGETGFSRALTVVCGMLSCDTPTPPNRKRVVIILTDGQPSSDEIPFNNNNPEPYFTALGQRHAALFKNADVWVLGLDKNDQFWSKNQSYWSQLVNHTARLTDPKDIAAKFREIAASSVGEPPGPSRACDGSTFKVDPYKETLTLILEYPDPDSKAEFILPTSEVLAKGMDNILGYTRSLQSETFIIKNPSPGDWRCQIVGSGVTPQFRDIQGLIRLSDVAIERLAGSSGSTCQEFGLTVRYFDADKNPVAELPKYPLHQKLTLIIEGQPTTRDLLLDSPDRDQWKTDAPAFLPGPKGGEYPVKVNAQLDDGTEVFSDSTKSILIDPKLPCMQIVAPDDGSTSVMHNRLSLTDMEVAVLLTQGGVPAIPVGVFREHPDQIVTGHLEGPDGSSRTIQLLPVTDQPGRFVAQLKELQPEGVYTFVASLRATTQQGQPYEFATQQITFTRIAGPWPARLILAIHVARWAGLLIALGLCTFFIVLITGPYPRGTLILEEKATGAMADIREWGTLTSIPLSRQRIFGVFRPRWPNIKKGIPKVLGMREVRVRRLLTGRDEGITVTFIRNDKKSPVTVSLPKDRSHKTFDGKYRVTYENYGSQQKRI